MGNRGDAPTNIKPVIPPHIAPLPFAHTPQSLLQVSFSQFFNPSLVPIFMPNVPAIMSPAQVPHAPGVRPASGGDFDGPLPPMPLPLSAAKPGSAMRTANTTQSCYRTSSLAVKRHTTARPATAPKRRIVPSSAATAPPAPGLAVQAAGGVSSCVSSSVETAAQPPEAGAERITVDVQPTATAPCAAPAAAQGGASESLTDTLSSSTQVVQQAEAPVALPTPTPGSAEARDAGQARCAVPARRATGPYVCEHCNKRCVCASALVVHLRTHSGERPFACDECDRRFARKSHLKVHQRVHSGEKPFSCDACGKTFTQVSNLRAHHVRSRLLGHCS